MKQVSVYLPERIYHHLEKMRDENIIPSISEFIRNVVILTVFRGRGDKKITIQERKVTIENKGRRKRPDSVDTLNKQVKEHPLFQKQRKKREKG